MDTSLLLYLDGAWQEVDLYEDIPITVVIQEVDIIDLQGRKSPYSKQFTVPGTSKNSNIFKHYYEVNGIEFNPLIKIQAAVQYRGTDIFNGIARLQAVIINDQFIEYEIYIMGDVGDFISQIKDLLLSDLEWSDVQHQLNYSSVTESWKADGGDTNGLFGGKILYPLINYGLRYSGSSTIPDWSFDVSGATSFTSPLNPVIPDYFKPAVRLREVLMKIFDKTDYTINSEFLDSPYFRSIYMDLAQNGQIGPVLGSGVTNENFFKVFSPNVFRLQPAQANNFQTQWSFYFTDLGNSGYDPLGNVTFTDLNNREQGGYFQVPYSGDYFWNLRFGYAQNTIYSQNTTFRVLVKVADSVNDLQTGGSILYQTPGTGLVAEPGNNYTNIFFSGSVLASQYVKVYLVLESGAVNAGLYITAFQGLTISDNAPMWELYGSPFITSATTIDMKFQMPDITTMRFMIGLVNQFNLVITQGDEYNTFNIEPLPWYLDENQRTERDFSDYLDINSPIEISALNFDLPKQINFRGFYNENETLNRQYLSNYQLLFGERRFLTDTSIPDGELTIETIFSPLPTDFISGSTNVIIPQLWYLEKDQEPIGPGNYPIPRQNSPHLFFYVGNRYFWKDWGDYSAGNQRRWWLLSGNTPIAQTTYPCVSHISSLDSLNAAQVSELNFYPSTDYYFGETTDFTKYVQNTTYRYFWQTHIENLYSPNARKYVGRFVMSPQYYADLKLTDKIWIKDAAFRIDRISNANLVEPALTEITLVKDLNLYYRETLWAPSVGIAPNSPYPADPGCVVFPVVCVFNFDSFLVCDRNTPVATFYSTDSNGLVDGANIYTTSGCTSPAETGLYLRETGSTENFVIDIFGQAISNGNC